MDFPILVYQIILVSSILNLVMCIYWAACAVRQGQKISTIFICFALMWIAVIITYGASCHVRLIGLVNDHYYDLIKNRWWWEYKNVLFAVFSVTITGIFVYRLLGFDDNHPNFPIRKIPK